MKVTVNKQKKIMHCEDSFRESVGGVKRTKTLFPATGMNHVKGIELSCEFFIFKIHQLYGCTRRGSCTLLMYTTRCVSS